MNVSRCRFSNLSKYSMKNVKYIFLKHVLKWYCFRTVMDESAWRHASLTKRNSHHAMISNNFPLHTFSISSIAHYKIFYEQIFSIKFISQIILCRIYISIRSLSTIALIHIQLRLCTNSTNRIRVFPNPINSKIFTLSDNCKINCILLHNKLIEIIIHVFDD